MTRGYHHDIRSQMASLKSESAVRTLKQLRGKNDDAQFEWLTYRTTSLQSGLRLSRSEMLVGRQPRTRLPTTHSKHSREWQNIHCKPWWAEKMHKEMHKVMFDLRHRVQDLLEPQPGNVWNRDMNRHGSVVKRSPQPRSYLVQTPKGIVRRNRAALVTMSDHHEDDIAEQCAIWARWRGIDSATTTILSSHNAYKNWATSTCRSSSPTGLVRYVLAISIAGVS